MKMSLYDQAIGHFINQNLKGEASECCGQHYPQDGGLDFFKKAG